MASLTEKKADKDYDGDGKVESSKEEYFGSKDKAIKKAMGKDVKEETLEEGMPPWLKDKIDKKDDKKSDKKDDCECKHSKDDKKDDKKSMKEDLEETGLFTAEEIEMILEKMTPEEKARKRAERKDEAEYAKTGESKEKSPTIKKAEERQKAPEAEMKKTKQLRKAEKPAARWGVRRKMANPMAQKPGDTGAENPGGKPVQG